MRARFAGLLVVTPSLLSGCVSDQDEEVVTTITMSGTAHVIPWWVLLLGLVALVALVIAVRASWRRRGQ